MTPDIEDGHVAIECPYHHTEMEYEDFVVDKETHAIAFRAFCKLCLNKVNVKLKL